MAPFCGFATLIGSDCSLNLPEHPAGDFADRRAQHIGGRLGTEVEHIHEIFRLEVIPHVLHTAGQEHIADARFRRSSEGDAYVEFIIPVEERIVNDVENLLPVVIPIFCHHAFGNRLNDIGKLRALIIANVKGTAQALCYSRDILVPHRP